jgi:hypothetical protein
MNMFAASGVYVEMSPWPQPFTMMERQGYPAALKITLSRGRLKCKNGRMMRTFLSWIQPHLYGATLRHLLITVTRSYVLPPSILTTDFYLLI